MEYEMIPHSHMAGLRMLIDEIGHRALHIHREFELILVLEGTLQLTSAENKYLAMPGQAIVLNPWQTHELRGMDGIATCLFLQISPDHFRSYYPGAPRLRFLCTQPSHEQHDKFGSQLAQAMISLSLDYLQQNTAYEFACMKQVNACFELLLRTLPWQIQNEQDTERESMVSQRLARIIDYVQENYSSKLLMEDIARQENLTVSFLTHFITKHLDMPLRSYLSLVRFEHARKLLEHNSLSLIEVSRECGFSDPRYMNKVFLEQIGCSAKEYRSQFASGAKKTRAHMGTETERILSDEEALHYLLSYEVR